MSTPDDRSRADAWARPGCAALWRQARHLALLALLQVAAAGAADTVDRAGSRWLPAGSAPTLGREAGPDLGGRPATLIYPDGTGLPAGEGTAAQGQVLYQAQCASCHGRHAEGNTAPELVGGLGPLSRPDADKTLATYWPYAPTLFDTILRSMPPAAPGRLSADQIYALCAWLLSQNALWPETRPLDAAGLASVRMPNRDGFISAAPP